MCKAWKNNALIGVRISSLFEGYMQIIGNVSTEAVRLQKNIMGSKNLKESFIQIVVMTSVPFDSHADGCELNIDMGMAWDDVRKSMLINSDYFLSSNHVGNMVVAKYFKKHETSTQ